MARFVFTGRGQGSTGMFVERGALAAELQRRGHDVYDRVEYGVDYLVASRTDTVKARAARDLGVQVITYAEMWAMLNGLAVPARQPGRGRTGFAPITQSMREAGPPIRSKLLGAELGAEGAENFVMQRKPERWADVTRTLSYADVRGWLGDELFRELPRLTEEELGIATGMGDTNWQDIDHRFNGVLHGGGCTNTHFIVARTDADYLVNTEGFNYCRYVIKLTGNRSGLPGSDDYERGVASDEPRAVQPIPGRRYVVLDEDAG